MIDKTIVNQGKNEKITVEGINYYRYCIKTHVITSADNIEDVVKKYASSHMQNGDVLFISEKAVACTQKRAIHMNDIHPRKLATLLCKFVTKCPYGIGLGIPETMEMALRECGILRILFAALFSAIGKLFNIHGIFYIIAGKKARSIDGPCHYTIPPYNEYVVLGPSKPNKVAKEISSAIGYPTLIVDINDLGTNILGKYPSGLNPQLYIKILKDNPLGQASEQTPIGIIRKQQ